MDRFVGVTLHALGNGTILLDAQEEDSVRVGDWCCFRRGKVATWTDVAMMSTGPRE